MSVRNINDLTYDPVVVVNAGKTIHVGRNGSVVPGKHGNASVQAAIIEEPDHPAAVHDNTFVIDGRLVDSIGGIITIGRRDDVSIGETGEVHGGYYGVWLQGNASTLYNRGEISGSNNGYGVDVTQSRGTHIRNDGMISGDIALNYDGDQGMIINGRNGVIVGDRTAVQILNHGTDAFHVTNHGLVIGSSHSALEFSGSAGHLVNDGTIRGDVRFANANDVFDNRGGRVTGIITGGAGDDVLIIDSARYHLTEAAGEGTDTIRASVSYTLDDNVERLVLIGKADINGWGSDAANMLSGNSGNNMLSGLGGKDTLSGGKGNDRLSGGEESDTFVFATGFGRDTLEDFLPGASDVIDLHGWNAIRSLQQLLHHASDHGDSVWITAGNDTLIIEHMHKADLGPSSNEILF